MTPQTPTGKRMVERRRDHDGYYIEQVGDGDILAIEREAAQQERERLRAAACDHPLVCSHHHLIIPTHLLADPEADR